MICDLRGVNPMLDRFDRRTESKMNSNLLQVESQIWRHAGQRGQAPERPRASFRFCGENFIPAMLPKHHAVSFCPCKGNFGALADQCAFHFSQGGIQVQHKGCPIKGTISKNGRIYHAPWPPWYKRTKVSLNKGERWFCSEREALDAGWRAPVWWR